MKAFEDAEEAAKQAQLSEIERTKAAHAKAQSELETYKRTAQERMVRYEVAARAAALGIIHPDAAAKLLDWSELEYDDDGTPTNADKLLEKLLKNMPYLARPATPEPPAPASPSQPTPAPHAPTVPAMNPGRSTIAAPTQRPPGQKPIGTTCISVRNENLSTIVFCISTSANGLVALFGHTIQARW